MKVSVLLAVGLFFSFFALTGSIKADQNREKSSDKRYFHYSTGETVYEWEGQLGFIELKDSGVLDTPFGVYYRIPDGMYPKWYGRDGFIILKDDRLLTPFGPYWPYYY